MFKHYLVNTFDLLEVNLTGNNDHEIPK